MSGATFPPLRSSETDERHLCIAINFISELIQNYFELPPDWFIVTSTWIWNTINLTWARLPARNIRCSSWLHVALNFTSWDLFIEFRFREHFLTKSINFWDFRIILHMQYLNIHLLNPITCFPSQKRQLLESPRLRPKSKDGCKELLIWSLQTLTQTPKGNQYQMLSWPLWKVQKPIMMS